MSEQNIRFPLLTTERYLDAVARAKRLVMEHVTPPRLEDFRVTDNVQYPSWFRRSVIGALVAVLLFSFVISAGKQAAAMGLVLDHLSAKFNHLSTFWSDLSIVFMLLMSEIGSILFLVASGTIASTAQKTKVFSWELNITQTVFRAFAGLCAGYAILGNVTITVLDPINNIATVLQWVVSFGLPLTVLGLGMMLERIVMDSLRANIEQQRRFNAAWLDYQVIQNDPTKHETYMRLLADVLYQAIMGSKRTRDALGEWAVQIEGNNDMRRQLVSAEYNAQLQQSTLSLESGAVPFLSAQADSLN